MSATATNYPDYRTVHCARAERLRAEKWTHVGDKFRGDPVVHLDWLYFGIFIAPFKFSSCPFIEFVYTESMVSSGGDIALAGYGKVLLIVTCLEGTVAFCLLLARIYTTWRITRHIRSDLYLSLATFVRDVYIPMLPRRYSINNTIL